MDKITTLPWRYDSEYGEIFDSDGESITDISGDDVGEYICQYICLAVNSHEGLVEALQKSKLVIEKTRDLFMTTETASCKEAIKMTNEFLDYLKEALKTADGE